MARHARGFTLIELMVGLALGLLTTLVITQVMAMAEGSKRSISMGSDAQVNGGLALYTLQQDIQMAGYGATIDPSAMGCPIQGGFSGAGGASVAFAQVLAPVVIQDAANGAPDQVTVMQSRKTSFSAPIMVSSDHPQDANFFVVRSSFGAAPGDLMIAVPADGAWNASTMWCSLFTVTDDGSATPTDTTLGHNRIPHSKTASPTSKWNANAAFPVSGYGRGSYLLNMGAFSHNTYSVDAQHNLNVLERTADSVAATPETLFSQVVNLQAMYGKDSDDNGQVDTYDTVTPTDAAGWQRVLAIRMALVVRSGQFEKEEVTLTPPLWDVGTDSTIADTTTCGSSQCLSLRINHVTDWKHYRYKVYDTVIPLRNVLWNSAGGAKP